MIQKPSIGRIVHYRSYGTPGGEFQPECRAAVVADLKGDDVVSLAVLNPTGLFFHDASYHDDTDSSYKGGTWHWPERIE
jgi:hypothetical protein